MIKENSKNQLFETLENILSTVTDINIMTQNQETIILHGAKHEMLSELAGNKQGLITRLDELEAKFQSIYEANKEVITSKQDIARLQGLVGKVVETKATIAQGEEKNRRLWASKETPKVSVEPVRQPKGYVIDQYKKYGSKP